MDLLAVLVARIVSTGNGENVTFPGLENLRERNKTDGSITGNRGRRNMDMGFYFGCLGRLNDIILLDQSSIFEDIFRGNMLPEFDLSLIHI